ncbi:MAG: hypothetical protein ACYS0G_10645 [Planctomycetota bacterium]|jgi:hypothetical protein
MRLRTTFLWTMIVSLVLAALLGIVTLLLPTRYGPHEEILGSTALFGAFSLMALMCATVLEKRRLVPLMWVGISAAALALVTWLALLWFERPMTWRVERFVARTGGTFTVASVLLAQTGLLALPRFDRLSEGGVRRATIGVSILLGAVIVALIWWFDPIEDLIDENAIFRILGVLCILTACGTIVTPILWKVQVVRRAHSAESIPRKLEVRVACPRCRTEQTMITGPSKCGHCGLRMTIHVEEPRCACGYLLYQLESDRCRGAGAKGRRKAKRGRQTMGAVVLGFSREPRST